MIVKVLGCSGGIGGVNLRTTSMLVDQDILVDAGSGVGDLSVSELTGIDHVFVTHSHLDHVAWIPFLVDTVGDLRAAPVTVWALPETIEALRTHIFNWVIWPDFSEIPTPEAPRLVYRAVAPGQVIELGTRKVTVLPANHTVPAVGYAVEAGQASFAFTGDTSAHAPLWQAINRLPNLRYLVIETAYSDSEADLAERSRHFSPSVLARELANLRSRPEVFITHLKPSQIDLIMAEVSQRAAGFRPQMLSSGHVFAL